MTGFSFNPIASMSFVSNTFTNFTGRVVNIALDTTALSLNAAASSYANAGLMLTRLVSGVKEIGVAKVKSERNVGVAPFYLVKKDHFIKSLDGKVDLLLAEVSFDRKNGTNDDSGIVRGNDYPAIFYSHGMFMNSNFGLFPIDGRGHIPNIDTIKTFLGFLAFLGFRVFYLHMRNAVHIQNRYVRNNSNFVTDPSLRPDLRGVPYSIPKGTTFDDLRDFDIGSALRYIVEEVGEKNIVAIAHSLGGDMLYDYMGLKRPYAKNIVGFVPLATPLRWDFKDEALIKVLIKIGKNAEAFNSLLEVLGSDRQTNPLGYFAERMRLASELLAGFSPAVGLLYRIATKLPFVKDALNTLRNTDGENGGVNMKIAGKFIRKCLEPMPPTMVSHFMRIVNSSEGCLTSHDGRIISEGFSNIRIPILAVAGEKDGLAIADRNIAPDFGKLASNQKKILIVPNADHFTTISGPNAPRYMWFEVAKWMHDMGFYPEYDASALERLYRTYINIKSR